MVQKSKILKNKDFAVIKTGGKQYLVTSGDEILIDRLKDKKNILKKGKTVQFETLMKENKGSIKIGNPILKSGMVKGKIEDEVKGDKIVVFKYKSKKRYRKKTGFRAKLSKIKILNI